MAESLVIYEVKDQIAFITMNRPEKRNALSRELALEMKTTWERFEQDPDARVAILSGAGKGFCAGADITPAGVVRGTAHAAYPENGITIFKPIVGAVHGFALGSGWALAMRGCDITIAAEGTQFGFPEALVGVPLGPTEPSPYMTLKVYVEFMLTGKRMSAERAYEAGIVNKVVPESELMAEAIRWAEMLKKIPPLAFRSMKHGIYRSTQSANARTERDYNEFVQPQEVSEDRKEAVGAFQEKREPVFKGK